MTRPKSESLLGDVIQTQQEVKQHTKSSMPTMKQSKDDYLFKDGVNNHSRVPLDKHEQTLSARSAWSFDNDRVFDELKRRDSYNIVVVNAFNDRLNEYRKRHYSLDGDVVVYCKVKNKWPQMVVESLTVPLCLSDKVPSMKCKEDEVLVKTVFSPLTVRKKRTLEPFIYNVRKVNNVLQTYVDNDEYARLAFLLCFKQWNIPIELKHVGDRLDDGAETVIFKRIHPHLFETIAQEFITLNEITEDEIRILDKQCDQLFARESRGVDNAVEGVKLYCEANLFAKEFALGSNELDKLPCRVATLLRYVANAYNKSQNDQFKEDQRKNQRKPSTIRRK